MVIESFTPCLVDEGFPRLFIKILQESGVDIISAIDHGLEGKDDAEVLDTAINAKRILITDDKKTFFVDSGAAKKKHFGIIIFTKQVSTKEAHPAAKLLIGKYLSVYPPEDWAKGLVVYI